jgi:serralysin
MTYSSDDSAIKTTSCTCSACVSGGESSGQSHQVSLAFSTGNAGADALLADFSWTGTTGQAATIGYGFNVESTSPNYFDSPSRSAARSAMSEWEHVANVDFTARSNNPDVTFSSQTFLNATQGGVAIISYVGQTIKNVEVQISSREPTLAQGSIGYLILLHEIGHALGLKHSGNYGDGDNGPFLSAAEDNYRASVMSYNPDGIASAFNPPTTPMLYDIAAIQALYGANTSYKDGNTTYRLTPDTNVQTLWDGGGTDLLSAANYSGREGVRLDLNAGLEHYSKVGANYTWIAFNANIENAEGSNSTDNIAGNELGNVLYGRGGADTMDAGAGNDTVFGGVGATDTTDVSDIMYGGTGNDQLYGNAGNDTVYGGRGIFDPEDGNDVVYGGKGSDAIYGNAGDDTMYGGGSGADPLDQADTMYGGKGADALYGNGSNDVIYGGGTDFDPTDNGDVIYGGTGNDALFGNGGEDSIYGGADNDTINGGVGDDSFVFDLFSGGIDQISVFEGAGVAGGDELMIAAGLPGSGINSIADVLARTLYDGSNAFVSFGEGQGVLIVGIGTTQLIADDIVIF